MTGLRWHADARRVDGLPQHLQVADVVGQQQHQARVEQAALFVAEAAVGVDQLFVEVVARREGVPTAKHEETSMKRSCLVLLACVVLAGCIDADVAGTRN